MYFLETLNELRGIKAICAFRSKITVDFIIFLSCFYHLHGRLEILLLYVVDAYYIAERVESLRA